MNGNRNLLVGAVVIAILLFAALARFQKTNRAEERAAAPAVARTDADAFARPDSPRFGNQLARVTVTEWFDPECEACRAVHPFVKKIIREYGDRVSFVMRFMPLHEHSLYASAALFELKERDKFEPGLDLFFEKQPEWGNHAHPKPEMIAGFLNSFGVPQELQSPEALIQKHGEKVRTDEADGMRVGVSGTPTFFVNGRMLEQLGEQPLRQAIDGALRP